MVMIATLGEAMLRLAAPPGERLQEAHSLDLQVGGSEANVAFALAQTGVTSSWTSVLPRNPLGRKVASSLASGGVDVSTVIWRDGARLGTYFIELGSHPRPTEIIYDRAGSAMSQATPDLFDWDRICQARLVHLSGITSALSAGCAEVNERAVDEAKAHGCKVSFDVNYRQRLWPSEAAADSLRGIAARLDVVICSMEDARDLFGITGSPEDCVRELATVLSVPTTVLTCGAEGAVALRGSELCRKPGHAVTPVDRIGAGDAFTAGFLSGFLEGSIAQGLEDGLLMSALKMTLRGDLFRFSREEVEAYRHAVQAPGADREVRR
jgi:2-dehydro-3-deoxygluconokinase